MPHHIYRVESVFSSPDSVFDLHIDQDFRCPFPTEDLDEFFGDFVYGLICEADEQISDLYGTNRHGYFLSSISFNYVGDEK